MIEMEKLCRQYNDVVAVQELSMRVGAGEVLGLLGPNGAGKTTIVKMLTGMIAPTSGRAMVAGYDVRRQPNDVKKRIGYVPESGALFESLTAWEYLELVTDLHHMERRVAESKIEEFLDLFGIFDQKDQYLSQYSKGMKQKVLLAASLLHNPQVLFLDEPLNGLDANAALVIKQLLRKLAEQGKTILFCSHILEVVERICSRIAILDHGKIVADGTRDEILKQTNRTTLEQAFAALTDSPDAGDSTQRILHALERT